MSKVILLPRSVREVSIPFGNRELLSPADLEAARPFRPDAALLIRLAILGTLGRERAPAAATPVHALDGQILSALEDLAARGCPTSSLVLSWLDLKTANRFSSGGENA